MIDLDKLEERYSGESIPLPPCPYCGATLEFVRRDDDGNDEWGCPIPYHVRVIQNSRLDKDVLSAVRELRDRRKDEIGYQKMIRQTIDLLESAEIDEAIELLEAWEDNDV